MVVDIKTEGFGASRKIEIISNDSVQEIIELSSGEHVSRFFEEKTQQNIKLRVYKDVLEYTFFKAVIFRFVLNVLGIIGVLCGGANIFYDSHLDFEFIEYILPTNRSITIVIREEDNGEIKVFSEFEKEYYHGQTKCNRIFDNIVIYLLALTLMLILFPLVFKGMQIFEMLTAGTRLDGTVIFAGSLLLLMLFVCECISFVFSAKRFIKLVRENKKNECSSLWSEEKLVRNTLEDRYTSLDIENDKRVINIKSGELHGARNIALVANGIVKEKRNISTDEHISFLIRENCQEDIRIRIGKNRGLKQAFLTRIGLNLLCEFILVVGWKGFVDINSDWLAYEYVEYILPPDKDITIKIHEDIESNLCCFSELENKNYEGLKKCDYIPANIFVYLLSLILTIPLLKIIFRVFVFMDKLVLWEGGPTKGWFVAAGVILVLLSLICNIISIFIVIKNFIDISKNNKK